MIEKTIEICVDSLQSAIIAAKAGANRLEVCRNINQGGTTPNLGLIKLIKNNVDIPVNVLIRPRAGNFIYSQLEKQEILADIDFFKQQGVNGIVCGFLTPNLDIDIDFLQKVIKKLNNTPLTFHRAFDLCNNPIKSLQILINNNVNKVLTSGQQQTAIQGHKLIKQLINFVNSKITIIAASGIRFYNVKKLYSLTGVNQVHATAFSQHIQNNTNSSNCTMGKDDSNNSIMQTDFDKVKQLVDNFRSL